jgi:hypothetical protein
MSTMNIAAMALLSLRRAFMEPLFPVEAVRKPGADRRFPRKTIRQS